MADTNPFAERLAVYKQIIDDDITAYAKGLQDETRTRYGRWPAEAEVDVFIDLLARGGKRIRGALVMVGYEMCGGQNQAMIVRAARAIEMLHAYILIIDDIQDRSALRRGQPTAHELVAALHKANNLKGDPDHTGISLALMGALAGAHAAQSVLVNLDVDPGLRLQAIDLVNQTMLVTAHGQTLDIMNELVDKPTLDDIERVLEWKSARYTIINPLQVGMTLAGGSPEATAPIESFGLNAGKAFQLTDDVLGIYGDEKSLGKVPGDDIREGKGTLLVHYALEHAAPTDKAFLQKSLGNADLTEADLTACKRIIEVSGARAHAQEQAKVYGDKAIAILETVQDIWSPEGVSFLRDLVHALQHRVS